MSDERQLSNSLQLQPGINLEWQQEETGSTTFSTSQLSIPSADDSSEDEDDISEPDIGITEQISQLEMSSRVGAKFLGSGSGFILVKDAMDVKSKSTGSPQSGHLKRPEYWQLQPVRSLPESV